MEVIYGGGEKGTVVSKVEALVVPDIQDNLVSLADFADRGSTIMLTADGGAIANSDFGTWLLRLADIVDYNHKHDSHSAFAASIAKSKLGRYIALHERSCNEVLIRALEGDSPSWISLRRRSGRSLASILVCCVRSAASLSCGLYMTLVALTNGFSFPTVSERRSFWKFSGLFLLISSFSIRK